MNNAIAVRAIASVLFFVLIFPAWAQTEGATDLLHSRLEALRDQPDPRVDDVPIASVALLPDLYASRDFQLAWIRPEQTAELIAAIRNSEAEGLDPTDYHLEELESRLTQIPIDNSAPSPQRVDLDILLTDSLIRLAYHYFYGKVDARELDDNWNFDRPLDQKNAIAALEKMLAATSLASALNQLLPEHVAYQNLKKALERYRQIQAAGGWQPVPQGPTLRSGDTDVRVVALRQRLVAEAFLSPASNQGELFDAEVEEAVKQFQDHHFLTADGVVGRGTLATLNVPIEARIDQLRVNLERGRWVLHDLESRFVIVDIAGFEAWYYNDNERVWASRVQVGKPYRATPVFRDQITYLDFNPTWTVPPTIMAKDILPKVKRDVSYLSKRNIKVLDRNGTVIDPHTLDWSKYSGRNFPYILRQDPGPNNALGRIKFMFPNPHFVYLHDTPSKSLFNRMGRAFSSGCIRVENPVELAELLLNDPERWNREQIRREFETAKTRSVRLKEPVPVLLFYWTARPDDNGHVRFKQDIYGRDTAVLQALNDEFKVHSRHARAAK